LLVINSDGNERWANQFNKHEYYDKKANQKTQVNSIHEIEIIPQKTAQDQFKIQEQLIFKIFHQKKSQDQFTFQEQLIFKIFHHVISYHYHKTVQLQKNNTLHIYMHVYNNYATYNVHIIVIIQYTCTHNMGKIAKRVF